VTSLFSLTGVVKVYVNRQSLVTMMVNAARLSLYVYNDPEGLGKGRATSLLRRTVIVKVYFSEVLGAIDTFTIPPG
jgi:hypothetical protein